MPAPKITRAPQRGMLPRATPSIWSVELQGSTACCKVPPRCSQSSHPCKGHGSTSKAAARHAALPARQLRSFSTHAIACSSGASLQESAAMMRVLAGHTVRTTTRGAYGQGGHASPCPPTRAKEEGSRSSSSKEILGSASLGFWRLACQFPARELRSQGRGLRATRDDMRASLR